MDAQLTRLPESIEIYEAALEGLSRVNEAIYRQSPSLPEIHAAGVVYRRELGEAWRHADDVVTEGWGDCEDLAAARVGWLRAKRIDRSARVKVVRTGPKTTHAIVQRGNGKLEDPSRDLGMRSPGASIVMDPLGRRRQMDPNNEQAETEYGEDWEEIGADPSDSAQISWVVEKTANGWRGTVRIPLDLGRCLLVSRTAPGRKPDAAVKKATSAASRVLSNPAVAALIPPQAKFALNLVQSEKARGIAKKLLKLF
jgi:hypothetical protein